MQDWLRLQSELILKNEKRTEQAAGCVGRYLPRSPSYAPMAGMKRISAGGRALLVAGALLVLYSLFYAPWFVVSGTRTDLPPGTYNGMGSTGLMNTLMGGPWAWFAFVWLVISAIMGLAIAAVGRRTRRLGALDLLVLLVYAFYLVVAPNYLNLPGPTGTASGAFAYGFLAAVLGSVFIEAGARLPHVVRAHYEVPTAAEWEDPVDQ